jgi:hypothetical protein
MNSPSASRGSTESSDAVRPMPGNARDLRPRPRRTSAAILWTVFALGLIFQAFSPHLKIVNNAFVMPEAEVKSGVGLLPAAIVNRERKLQALSGSLVLGAALGLAYCYRRNLIDAFSRSGK